MLVLRRMTMKKKITIGDPIKGRGVSVFVDEPDATGKRTASQEAILSTDDYARGFAAGIEAAAKALHHHPEMLRCIQGADQVAEEILAALAASTVTVDTGTGPYRAGIGTEPMPIPQPDALNVIRIISPNAYDASKGERPFDPTLEPEAPPAKP